MSIARRMVVDGIVFEVEFTRHAVERMAERGIGVEEALDAIREPCSHAYDKEHDVSLILGCNRVAVVYVQSGARLTILTVMGEKEYRYLVGHVGGRRYRRPPSTPNLCLIVWWAVFMVG